MLKNILKLALAVSIGLTALASAVQAAPIYMRSTVGQPWGQNTNEAAMNSVFGVGNWSDLRYETVNTATLFSAATPFIFMEGGDSNATELETFVTSNLSTMQNWVSGGGRLFINAAPNENNGMNMGFGVTLNYGPGPFCGVACNAVNPAHPIFNGPFAPAGISFGGNWFSHATVSGGGITPLITFAGGDILGELTVGSGLALFGGMTTTNFHNPQPNATNLRRNIIAYTYTAQTQLVPEPGTLALLGIGIAALGFTRCRRAA